MIGDEKKIGIKNVRLDPKGEERQQVRKLWQEEEEEQLEIREYYQRLEYMRDNCPVWDQEISGLIEEQQEMLQVLEMKKGELLDGFGRRKDFDEYL